MHSFNQKKEKNTYTVHPQLSVPQLSKPQLSEHQTWSQAEHNSILFSEDINWWSFLFVDF